MEQQQAIELLTTLADGPQGFSAAGMQEWRLRTLSVLDRALGADHPISTEFRSIQFEPGPREELSRVPAERYRATVAQSATATIFAAIFDLETFSPTIPSVSGGGFHPWVEDAAARLWDSGHHKSAVEAAARKVDLMIRDKVSSAASGVNLMTQAFNPKPPTAGQARLRFPEFDEGTEDWTSAHQGAFDFARGCAARIRNLVAHRDDELAQQVALEYLAALSVLARWADGAVVATPSA